ncbi:competence protein ComEC [Arthrobacter woluwensis]|uniref:ComEC/Rec2 family competence protein n=1 Tax=Arthrobacter woluwensis TaxID=156980 RepID=UPI00277FF617|nr:ComEC/Rec2 family competence protein [Arthrobacter woluwensis]MDQ0708676.1 competence protein ComEC [Arthrobacter woluwensis]
MKRTVILRRAVRGLASLLAVAKAALRSRDEELERRLLLRETTHDVRLVPVLCLLWVVSAVTAARDEALLRVLAITGAAALGTVALWWFFIARRLRRPRTGRPRRSVGAGLALGVLVALLGCLLGLVRTADPGQRQLWSAVEARQAITVLAKVAGHPEALPQEPGRGEGATPQDTGELPEESPCVHGCRFTVRLQRIGSGATQRSLDLAVDAQCLTVCTSLRYGQEVQLMLRLKERDGRPGSLSGTVVARPRFLAAPSLFEAAVSRLRQGFLRRSRAVAGDPGALLDGMVLGDRSRAAPESAAVMTTTGLTHLTAVSGANCSVVFASVVLVLRGVRVSRPAVMLLSLLSLAAFGALVGPDSSVLRAVVMSGAGLVVMMGGHRGRGLPLLCVSASGLLLAEPWLAWDLGFALSVAATAGILVSAQGLAQWLARWMPYAVALGLSIPLAANLACAPLLVLIQPQLTPYSMLSNALTAPLVTPVTLLGTAALPLTLVPGPFSGLLIGWAGLATQGIWTIAQVVSGLPGALVDWPPGALGLFTMAAFGACQVGLLWLLAHPRTVLSFYRRVHALLRDGPRRSPPEADRVQT